MTGVWPPVPGPQPPFDGAGPVPGKGPGGGVFTAIRGSGFVRPLNSPVAGVCAAVGHRLGIDPLLVRILMVMAGLVGGIGVVTYGVAWLLLPGADGRIHAEQVIRRGELSAGLLGGVGLILMGTSGSLSWLDGGFTFTLTTGLVVLAAVAAWLFRTFQRADVPPRPQLPSANHSVPAVNGAPWGAAPTVSLIKEPMMNVPAAPPAPESPAPRWSPEGAPADAPVSPAGSSSAAVLDLSAAGVQHAAAPAAPAAQFSDSVGRVATEFHRDMVAAAAPYDDKGVVPGVVPLPAGSATPPFVRRPRRPAVSGRTVAVVGGLALIAAAGALVADRALPVGSAPFTGAAAPAVALAVIAVATIIAGLRGRRGGGLVGLGVLALVLTLTGPAGGAAQSVLVDENGQVATDFGDRAWTLSGPVTDDHAYRVRMGQATLDLSGVTPLPAGEQPGTLTLQAQAGELVVRVPDDLTVSYDITADTGSVTVSTAGGNPVESTSQQGVIGPAATPDVTIVGTAELAVIRIEQVTR